MNVTTERLEEEQKVNDQLTDAEAQYKDELMSY